MASLITPEQYVGRSSHLCQERRGIQREIKYLTRPGRITYDLPLNEIVMDFYDKLKTIRGIRLARLRAVGVCRVAW